METVARKEDSFVAAQRAGQAAYFAGACPDRAGHEGSPYRLSPADFELNLAPSIRAAASDYFARYKIAWHRHVAHGLSSQVCCLNFLMPLATKPDLLAQVIGDALDMAPPEMLCVEEGAFGEPWYVGFEWIGERDYLNEAGRGARTRGANVTSADAVVRFRSQGCTETLLIEWKYTEAYGSPISSSGNATRLKRYEDLAFAPEGPIRADLGLKLEDFFWEPFYQLLRQQMLAWRMQAAHEMGADRVRVLHISPSANQALHKVTARELRRIKDKTFSDAFEAFSAVLMRPDDFISRATEEVFGRAIESSPDHPWASYLKDRYGALSGTLA